MPDNTDWDTLKEMFERAGIEFKELTNGGTARDSRTGEVVLSSEIVLDLKGTEHELNISFDEDKRILLGVGLEEKYMFKDKAGAATITG